MPKLRVLDLFSGIGGFSLGLEMTGGFQTVQFVEQDEKCQRVLRKHWPEVPIHGDIKTYEPSGAVDVVCGGFPCQPFSCAARARAKGVEDERYLWGEMARVVGASRPTWVVCENVDEFALLALDDTLADLENLGYETWTGILPANAVGAPHLRRRTWVVAHADRDGESALGFDDEASGLSEAEGIAYPLDRLEWPAPPEHLGVADGLPGRMDRLRQLGNAVVPQVVAQIGYAILAAHESD